MSENNTPEQESAPGPMPEMTPEQKRLANLRPAQKGEVRNPKGRTRGALNLKTVLHRWLSTKENIMNPVTQKKEKLTQLDIITLRQIQAARGGDLAAFNALLDRVDGKPVQKNIHTGDPDPDAKPIQVEEQVIVIGGQEIKF